MLTDMDTTVMWGFVLIGGGGLVAGSLGIALPARERLAAFLPLVIGAGVGVAALAIGVHDTDTSTDAESAFLVASSLGFVAVVVSAAIVWWRASRATVAPPPD
jgi:hypothetical protein